jgi:hypothetical protein
MRTTWTIALAAALLAQAGGAQETRQAPGEEAASRPLTPLQQVEAVDRELDKLREEFSAKLAAATTEAEKEELFEKYPKPDVFFPRMFEIAASDPKGAGAEAALTWIVENDHSGKHMDPALDTLLRDHAGSEGLSRAAEALQYSRSLKALEFLEGLEQKSPHRAVKGQALYARAQVTWGDLKRAERARPDADHAEARKSVEELLERVKTGYGDLEAGWGGTLGKRADGDLFELRNLGMGMVAPEIEGEDIDGKPMKLSDYAGKVVVLDFWGNW